MMKILIADDSPTLTLGNNGLDKIKRQFKQLAHHTP
jgi:hypothetical protein